MNNNNLKEMRVKLDINRICNQACGFCPYFGNLRGLDGQPIGIVGHGKERKIPKDRLSLGEITGLLDGLHDMGITPSLDLSGWGEPTLHPQFASICEVIRTRGLEAKIITNGTTAEHYAELLASTFRSMTVSIHGDEDAHNEIVGHPNAYRMAVNGLERVAALRGQPGMKLEKLNIAHVITPPGTLDQLSANIDLAMRLRIPIKYGHDFLSYITGENKRMDLDALESAIRELKTYEGLEVGFTPDVAPEHLRQFLEGNYSSGNYIFDPSECHVVERGIEVGADGSVYHCWSEPWGNIKVQPIQTILESEGRRAFIENIHLRAQGDGLPTNCDRCHYQTPNTELHRDSVPISLMPIRARR